jgi:hypothetical protein
LIKREIPVMPPSKKPFGTKNPFKANAAKTTPTIINMASVAQSNISRFFLLFGCFFSLASN